MLKILYFYDRSIGCKYKNMKTHQNLMICVIINVLQPWKTVKLKTKTDGEDEDEMTIVPFIKGKNN